MNSFSSNSLLPSFPQLSNGLSSHPKITISAIPRAAVAEDLITLTAYSRHVLSGSSKNLCSKFCGLKLWLLENLYFQWPNIKHERKNEFKILQIDGKDDLLDNSKASHERQVFQGSPASISSNDYIGAKESSSYPEGNSTYGQPSNASRVNVVAECPSYSSAQHAETSAPNFQFDKSTKIGTSLTSPPSFRQTQSFSSNYQDGRSNSLSIAVIGATGELARRKIFPALFALYYSGFLPENVSIFGYSRKKMTDDELRSMIASTLTCRIDQQQNCEDKMDDFLRRTYYLNGGYDNREGMSKLSARMEQMEGEFGANRMFYLSVPQEALLDVSSSLADNAQSQKGWTRIIIEKPFGFDSQSSHQLTHALLSKIEEKQLYRIDHLLGRNTIENLTVLRFSNLVFMPLWNRNYIRNVQVILSEDLSMQIQSRYPNGYGIIGDIVHSHVFQTIALLAMEPPVTLDGEDVRNEKVKLLRSIRKLEPSDVILGQCTPTPGGKGDTKLEKATPTFFAAALYIDNARWDGVPFLIKVGRGLSKHRVEIRIQFRDVPGNLFRRHIQHNINLSTNELILHDVPDEAILVRVNNKIPGLGIHLDASELNLLYKDKYNVEVPDSYEQLLHDVIDGDNHLFMRSDEVAAAWNVLSPVLHELDNENLVPEQYELGGRGPDEAIYLWAKHGVRWLDD
ncbi:glucose-6-phosphate 1-dehydrogenase 4, chloroplastic isoform X1 [Olea europaea subsp. europaea]|uniref:Glucose-6-phosphate 1-dehydrogenase n=1 Tax=Olea europaea subsp. europaea TaxID=158383 RepID=A0A8S0V680_OLEEU|nr:glucose-6-phosphate 1-dehydrogenase 4, chloroplastic isoform X1 [Olea europaea subsp. europaea]